MTPRITIVIPPHLNLSDAEWRRVADTALAAAQAELDRVTDERSAEHRRLVAAVTKEQRRA